MTLRVQLAPVDAVPTVRYRWDPDTDILSAAVEAPAAPLGVAEPTPAVPRGLDADGAIEVEGAAGSWPPTDLVRGRIGGVQVAVWPAVHRRSALAAPEAPARAAFAVGTTLAGTVTHELSARVAAETDATQRHFHFRFGALRPAERARIARDVVLEVDEHRRLAGLWLLNVPPFPHAP